MFSVYGAVDSTLISCVREFRRQFVADFHKGVQSFIDEYWKMIHRAAGWDALRYWLLVSVNAGRHASIHEKLTPSF